MIQRIIVGACLLACLQLGVYAQEADSVSYQAMLLAEADSMPVGSGQLLVLPGQGLFVVNGSTFYSLDSERCPKTEKFRVLEGFPFEQVVVSDGTLIVKSQQFLMQLGEAETEILAELDTEDFTLFGGRDSILNLVSMDDSLQYVWYKFDRRTGDMECVMRQTEPIGKIVSGRGVDFCLIGGNVYCVYGDQCSELVISEEPVLDIVLLPQGLMFCTDTMLALIGDDAVAPLSEGDFHGLLSDDGVVYVVMKNGNIWKLSVSENTNHL